MNDGDIRENTIFQEKAFTLVDLAEDDNTRKLCLGIVGDGGVEDENTYQNTYQLLG